MKIRVLRSDDHTEVIIFDGARTVSKFDGVWVQGSAFDHYELSEFKVVRDQNEIDALIAEAKEQLVYVI